MNKEVESGNSSEKTGTEGTLLPKAILTVDPKGRSLTEGGHTGYEYS